MLGLCYNECQYSLWRWKGAFTAMWILIELLKKDLEIHQLPDEIEIERTYGYSITSSSRRTG